MPQEADAEAYDWSGFSIGLQAGHVWSQVTQVYSNGDYSRPDATGFLGGIYAGYNHQFSSNLVLGGEIDWSWSGADGSSLFYTPAGAPFPANFVSTFDLRWTAAARVRVGYALDRWSPYVAGGVAAARGSFAGNTATTVFDPGGTETYVGWTIGAGAEYAATDKLIVRGEYRYSDFGSRSFNSGYDISVIAIRSHDVRLGVAYKF